MEEELRLLRVELVWRREIQVPVDGGVQTLEVGAQGLDQDLGTTRYLQRSFCSPALAGPAHTRKGLGARSTKNTLHRSMGK